MEQDGIEIVVERWEVIFHGGRIDAWSKFDLVPDIPSVDELPVFGKD